MNLREVDCEGVHSITLSQYMVQDCASVNTEMNFFVP
jgi:hypothetical protein